MQPNDEQGGGDCKWERGLCSTAVTLNCIQSCHLESIVLPKCWQVSAQCVDCILPFSFLICFSSPILRVTQHYHSETFTISPVISLFFLWQSFNQTSHSVYQPEMCYSDRNTKKPAITPRGPVPPLRYSCRKEGTIPNTSSSSLFFSFLSSACWKIGSLGPSLNDRG